MIQVLALKEFSDEFGYEIPRLTNAPGTEFTEDAERMVPCHSESGFRASRTSTLSRVIL
jgi:hypothetical protein